MKLFQNVSFLETEQFSYFFLRKNKKSISKAKNTFQISKKRKKEGNGPAKLIPHNKLTEIHGSLFQETKTLLHLKKRVVVKLSQRRVSLMCSLPQTRKSGSVPTPSGLIRLMSRAMGVPCRGSEENLTRLRVSLRRTAVHRNRSWMRSHETETQNVVNSGSPLEENQQIPCR